MPPRSFWINPRRSDQNRVRRLGGSYATTHGGACGSGRVRVRPKMRSLASGQKAWSGCCLPRFDRLDDERWLAVGRLRKDSREADEQQPTRPPAPQQPPPTAVVVRVTLSPGFLGGCTFVCDLGRMQQAWPRHDRQPWPPLRGARALLWWIAPGDNGNICQLAAASSRMIPASSSSRWVDQSRPFAQGSTDRCAPPSARAAGAGGVGSGGLLRAGPGVAEPEPCWMIPGPHGRQARGTTTLLPWRIRIDGSCLVTKSRFLTTPPTLPSHPPHTGSAKPATRVSDGAGVVGWLLRQRRAADWAVGRRSNEDDLPP